jgi:hypothetical protein
VGTLTQGCGQQCTADGMHHDGEVYDAVLHITLNALVIESQLKSTLHTTHQSSENPWILCSSQTQSPSPIRWKYQQVETAI